MRNSFWIALDLVRDAAASGAFLAMALFLGCWLPLQAGMLDGLTGGLMLAPSMRRSLVMNASWPVLAMVGIQAHVFLPRRISRELEPLAALPVTDFQIALGLSLPVLAAAILSAPLTFILNEAGYRVAAGRFSAGLEAQLAELWLGTLAAGLILGAAALDGCLRGRGQAGFSARVAAGYCVLALVDALIFVLRLLAMSTLVLPALCAAIVLGLLASWMTARRLDRELLVL